MGTLGPVSRATRGFWAVLALVALLWSVGCGSNTDEPERIATRTGEGTLAIHLVDAPADALEIWVTIVEVSIRSCDGGGWTDLDVDALEVDLLTLQDGGFATVASNSGISAGHYCEFRLVLDGPARLTLESSVVEAKVPSGSSSGIKFKGDFHILPSVETTVVIDFDAALSIHQTGNGSYVMNPIISQWSVDYSSLDGLTVPGASPDGSVSFTITPETEGIVELPGGAQMEFQVGSVLEPTDLFASLWVPELNDARGGVYVFGPATEFESPPRLRVPATPGPPPSMLLDYGMLETNWSQQPDDTYLVSADVPHFSCAGLVTRFDGFLNDQWYSNPIMAMDQNGVFDRSEFSDGFFDPQAENPGKAVRRDQMIAMIVRSSLHVEAEDLPELNTAPYADVPTDQKFAKYIEYLSDDVPVLDGCGDGNFCPDQALRRGELAKLIVETLYETGRDKRLKDWATNFQNNPLGDFDPNFIGPREGEYDDVQCDTGGQCDWFYGYVYAVRRAGIMVGDGGAKTFRPGDKVNRVEAAVAACKLAYGDRCTTCDPVAFSDLVANYPTDANAAEQIGGMVAFGKGAGAWYSNTCAIRMSHAFNMSGESIPYDFPGKKDNIITGANNLWYAYRVGDFITWLTGKYGQPQKVTKAAKSPYDMAQLPNGIIVFKIAEWDDATGHIDLLNNGACVGTCKHSDGETYEYKATELLVWELK